METFGVAICPHGKKVPVEGFSVSGGLAVTKAFPFPSERSPWWHVTHRPTGRIIGRLYSTKAEAKRIAMTLIKIADDCGFVWGDIKTVKQFWALPKETIKAIKAAVGPVGIEIGLGVRK